MTAVEEYREAVRLQKEIWGFSEEDALPVRLFVVASKIGGQIFGAFDGARIVGFCVALPGIKPGGGNFLHSNMLGVEAPYRDKGVGRLLKLAQRNDALARGIDLMEWTFDPLEIKNAYFNMERLGAVVKRYVLNQYGVTSSALHAGLPTDRCVAEWFMDSGRVRGILAGEPLPRPPIEARIEVPLNTNEPKRDIQARVSSQFVEYLRQGLTAVGVERSENKGTYLLARWEPES
ncbi:MAG: acetyltransferase [Bryobacteraceae bacterium]